MNNISQIQNMNGLHHSQSDGFLGKIMAWLCLAFTAAAFGTALIGPMIPASFMLPLALIALGALILAAFTRKSDALAPVFAIVIPLILGITLYPTLNYYFATGAGDVVISAAAGTAIVFGLMAFLGWTSSKSLEKWSGRLFMILIAVIVLSLLNVFFFKLSILSFLISCVTLVIFSIYTFIDVQRIRDRSPNDTRPAASYALDIFLDIWNIFISLLNILSYFRN